MREHANLKGEHKKEMEVLKKAKKQTTPFNPSEYHDLEDVYTKKIVFESPNFSYTFFIESDSPLIEEIITKDTLENKYEHQVDLLANKFHSDGIMCEVMCDFAQVGYCFYTER